MEWRAANPCGMIFGLPIMFIIGFAFLWIGGSWHADTQRRIATMVPATGTIVALDARTSRTSDRNGLVYYPVVEFRTSKAETIRFQGEIGSNPSPYKVGDQVKVLYDPQAPQSAVIDSWEIWLPSTVLLGFGGIFVLIGVLSVLSLLKLGGLLALLGAILWGRRGS